MSSLLEGPVTVVTLVGRLPSVGADVRAEIRLGGETLLARLADKALGHV